MIRVPDRLGAMSRFLVALAAMAAGGPVFGQNVVDQSHWCYGRQFEEVHCEKLDWIKNPRFNETQELIILPHRFLWGDQEGTGPAENSEEALDHLVEDDFGITEVDFMPLKTQGSFILSHDYVTSRLTNATGEERGWKFYEKNWNDISHLKLYKRNGQLSSDSVFEGAAAIARLIQEDILVFADLKQRPSNPDQFAQEWMNVANAVMSAAAAFGPDGLSHLVFKTSYSPDYILPRLDDASWFHKVNWMPQVANDNEYALRDPPGVDPQIQSSAEFVDAWSAYHEDVAAFETNYKGPDDSRRQSFTRNGHAYENILHYIADTTGYRGGVFAEEPVGRRGVVNREAVWDIKDVSDDRRGDPLFEAVHISFGQFIVVTTDRPDVWRQYQQLMERLPPNLPSP